VGDVVPGSLGRVVEGYEAQVRDDDGREVPRGEVGTLWVRGGSIAVEYWHDDLLKVGGKWLVPLEVENCLLTHPAVRECAVVGFKDAEGLEKPRAFVVVREGHAASPELVAELQAHVRSKLEPYKYPRDIRFSEALPRSERGKMLKAQLKG
jgi:acyl-coenzyme A synthetase/AMP-(fatty) acid ligase